MKRFFVLVSLCLLTVCCDVREEQEESEFSVVSGKLIESVVFADDVYRFTYDEYGRLCSASVDSGTSSSEYVYEYFDNGDLMVSCLSWIYFYDYDKNGNLMRFDCHKNDENIHSFEFGYSDGHLEKCVLDSSETVYYTWENGNVSEISNGMELSYTDIKDNFNIYLPFLTSLPYYQAGYEWNMPMIGRVGSACLPASIRYKDNVHVFKYIRNDAGDVCRIESGNMSWDISYY